MIDASIYRSIQQPQAPDQMAQYGRMMQIRNMMDQGELAGLQRNKLVKDIASEDAFRQAFDSYDPANHTQTIASLYRADPMRAMQFEKSRLESKKLSGEIDSNAITQQANVLKWFRDRLSAVNDDAGMAQLKADLSNLPGGQMYAASIPQTFDPEWKKSRIMTAEELLLRTRPDRVQVNNGQTIRFVDRNDPVAAAQPVQMLQTPAEKAAAERADRAARETERHNRVTEATAAAGVDRADWQYDPERALLVNKRTGATRAATDASGQPIQTSPKLTEAQGKATGFGMRATEADKILRGLEDKGVTNTGIIKSTVSGVGGLVPFAGDKIESGINAAMNTVPGVLGGPNSQQQQTEQARRDFVNAVLRVESGATITPQEFENASKQYFPQPGDSKDTIEQKRRNRQTAINALTAQAGPGASRVGGVNPANLSDAELKRELGLK